MSPRRIRLASCVSVGVLCLLGLALADEGSPDAALERAAAHLESGRVSEAVSVLEDALADLEDPRVRAPLQAVLGRALVQSGEAYAALKHLEAAAEHRGRPDDHLALAETLLAIARKNAAGGGGDWIDVGPYLQDAIAEAARAQGDGETRGRRQALVGEARYWMGEPEAAAEAWASIEAGDLPEAETARIADLQARVLYDLERYEDAARAFGRAGNDRGVASALAAARKGREAVEVYARLLATDPGNQVLLDEALQAARYTGAEADLAGALADLDVEGEARSRVLVTRALLAESSGVAEAAERLAAAAVEADPRAARPHFELGRLRLLAAGGNEDRLDAAVEALLASLALDIGNQDLTGLLWQVAGRDYGLAWRSPRAGARSLRLQRALAEANPDDELAWANLGNTLRIAGRADEAVAAYDRALAIEPYDPAILSDRGLALSARGDAQAALEAFEAAIEVDPDFDAARQNAARQHWLAGRDDQAARHLAEAEQRTRAAGGNWMRYRFLLDRVYRTTRRPDVR